MFDILKELKEADLQRLKSLCKTIPEDELSMKMPAGIPDEAKFKFKISSEAVDRDGEVVKASGIDMKWYKKNPIVLLNHWYSVENIIGKTTNIWQEGTDTYAEGYFSQTNPLAKLVQDMYNEGMVNVVSIGFMVKERDVNDRNIISKCELLEFSICAVQSNRDAERVKELAAKGVEMGLIVETKEVSQDGEDKEKEKKLENDNESVTMEKQIQELSEKFSGLETQVLKALGDLTEIVKSFADDKAEAERKAIEEAKNLKTSVQDLAKRASAYLENAKKL